MKTKVKRFLLAVYPVLKAIIWPFEKLWDILDCDNLVDGIFFIDVKLRWWWQVAIGIAVSGYILLGILYFIYDNNVLFWCAMAWSLSVFVLAKITQRIMNIINDMTQKMLKNCEPVINLDKEETIAALLAGTLTFQKLFNQHGFNRRPYVIERYILFLKIEQDYPGVTGKELARLATAEAIKIITASLKNKHPEWKEFKEDVNIEMNRIYGGCKLTPRNVALYREDMHKIGLHTLTPRRKILSFGAD